jgi:hypothetical protein
MSDSNSSGSNGGIGFCGMLAILFIGLKLTHHIDWSWWWVLSPLWIPMSIALAMLAIWLLVVACGAIGGWAKTKRRTRVNSTEL